MTSPLLSPLVRPSTLVPRRPLRCGNEGLVWLCILCKVWGQICENCVAAARVVRSTDREARTTRPVAFREEMETGMSAGGSLDTFPKLLRRNAVQFGRHAAFRHKDLGIWQSWSWADVLDNVRAYAVGL